MPVENPATLIAAGHGYGYHCFEKCSTVSFTYSVDRSHASAPTLSGGYTLIASDFFPSGRLIRAASQTNTGDALHATSRVWSMWKCQVSVPPCFGRLAGSLTSAARANDNRLVAVARLLAAAPSRSCVSTSFGFTSSPEPATIIVRRHGDVVVEVPVLQIELAADVGQRVPAAQVVIHAHPRIPLRHVVDLALLRLAPRSPSAPHAGNLVVVLDVDLQLRAMALQRLGQPNLHARIGDQIVGLHGRLARLDFHRVEDIAFGRRIAAPVSCTAARPPRCSCRWPVRARESFR